jgi:hypothetical protein
MRISTNRAGAVFHNVSKKLIGRYDILDKAAKMMACRSYLREPAERLCNSTSCGHQKQIPLLPDNNSLNRPSEELPMIASKLAANMKINAAFLQEVKDSNLVFWQHIQQLRAVTERVDSAAAPVEIVQLLSELRSAMSLEFTLEETYGYIQGGRPGPLLGSSKAAKAKQQHRDLYLALHEISERAEESEYRGTVVEDLPELTKLCSDFLYKFDAHEDFESEIVRECLGFARSAKS